MVSLKAKRLLKNSSRELNSKGPDEPNYGSFIHQSQINTKISPMMRRITQRTKAANAVMNISRNIFSTLHTFQIYKV